MALDCAQDVCIHPTPINNSRSHSLQTGRVLKEALKWIYLSSSIYVCAINLKI